MLSSHRSLCTTAENSDDDDNSQDQTQALTQGQEEADVLNLGQEEEDIMDLDDVADLDPPLDMTKTPDRLAVEQLAQIEKDSEYGC